MIFKKSQTIPATGPKELRLASNQISLKPKSIARTLGGMALLVVLANAAIQLIAYLTGHNNIFGLFQFFYIDAQQNLPTFFSTILLLFTALLLGVITILKRKEKASHVLHWMFLSFGFLYMSFDETNAIHELLVRLGRILLGDGRSGIFYFAWVIPVIALTVILAVFFLDFLRHLPSKTRVTFLVAATLFLGGSIGVELIGGRYAALHGENWIYKVISTVEESLEMAGIIVFIWALLEYIADHYKEVRFQFETVREGIAIDSPKA